MTIEEDGSKVWRNRRGEWHRENGPAHELPNGYKSWWFNGLRHRICGPAVEWSNGNKWWWVRDRQISELVRELLSKSPFAEDVHLGILAEYFAEQNDFRLQGIIDAATSKYRQEISEAVQ